MFMQILKLNDGRFELREATVRNTVRPNETVCVLLPTFLQLSIIIKNAVIVSEYVNPIWVVTSASTGGAIYKTEIPQYGSHMEAETVQLNKVASFIIYET